MKIKCGGHLSCCKRSAAGGPLHSSAGCFGVRNRWHRRLTADQTCSKLLELNRASRPAVWTYRLYIQVLFTPSPLLLVPFPSSRSLRSAGLTSCLQPGSDDTSLSHKCDLVNRGWCSGPFVLHDAQSSVSLSCSVRMNKSHFLQASESRLDVRFVCRVRSDDGDFCLLLFICLSWSCWRETFILLPVETFLPGQKSELKLRSGSSPCFCFRPLWRSRFLRFALRLIELLRLNGAARKKMNNVNVYLVISINTDRPSWAMNRNVDGNLIELLCFHTACFFQRLCWSFNIAVEICASRLPAFICCDKWSCVFSSSLWVSWSILAHSYQYSLFWNKYIIYNEQTAH